MESDDKPLLALGVELLEDVMQCDDVELPAALRLEIQTYLETVKKIEGLGI